MFVIAGVSGNTERVVGETLLAHRQPVALLRFGTLTPGEALGLLL